MRLLYLVYGIIVLFGTTFFNIGDTGRSGSSSGYSSTRGWVAALPAPAAGPPAADTSERAGMNAPALPVRPCSATTCWPTCKAWPARTAGRCRPGRARAYQAAQAAGATVVDARFRHFGPGLGVTGVLLLKEVAISIHTWRNTALPPWMSSCAAPPGRTGGGSGARGLCAAYARPAGPGAGTGPGLSRFVGPGTASADPPPWSTAYNPA
ncbi:S-adenosylmethionine decarboxylase [Cupriavidus basilensis]